ncbi:phage holin family protein [Marmoricola sp. URHB0036]|uniref:phage holin family protein n=1 Tax=Marmoricola sp. URHB0036 TaxID=1298863 RepID=UPI00040548B1|nr:phage holin family protein [Marmoricola sp. URHB0036]
MSARLRLSDLGRMALSWAISSLALIAAAAVLPGLSSSSPWQLVAAAAVTAIFGIIIRPVLIAVATTIGWLAVALLAITSQAVAMHAALLVLPGVEATSFWTLVAATWIAAAIATVLTWMATAGNDDAFTAALRRFGHKTGTVSDPGVDGVVFVQMDGVPFPVAHWALQSGTMPTLARWVSSGSHRLDEWTVQLPCTTPASQQGILHGTCDRVPAFRWYDRELGRVLVANRPADAAVIEARASNGRGLLADDGVSVSNLFSGDAPLSMMTMSKVNIGRGSRETRRTVARFVARPDGFTRSIARTTAEVVRERFQAASQNRRNVVPRMHRSWTFALLRAVSNALMRDLNLAIVAHQMMRGARSIYVDFVDYDEVAHHAGGTRLESLEVLTRLDQALAVLEEVTHECPRRYHFVVLSDHGQSQGAPFADRYGTTLGELCSTLTSQGVLSLEENVESWGRAESLLDDLSGDKGVREQTAGKAAAKLRSHSSQGTANTTDDLVVLGSGNLGLVYAPQDERLTLEDIEVRWPRLLPGLAAHPGIGFIAVLSREHGPVVIGADGYRRLRPDEVSGLDPLRDFAPHAARVLLRAVEMPTSPDIYVNSAVDPSSLEVSAFEDLVGAHGGLGGWQDRGTFVAPTDLVEPGLEIHGAEQLHEVLVSILERLGHRTDLTADGPVSAPASAP